MMRRLLFVLYYLRALRQSKGDHLLASALAYGDVVLHAVRQNTRRKARSRP